MAKEYRQQSQAGCLKVCNEEFSNCMQFALDGFLMGACMEQQENCEKRCAVDPSVKD
jgi:hypothetical protein